MTKTYTYEVQPVQSIDPSIEPCGPTNGKRGSCVLVHGWDADGSSMKRLCDKLQPLGTGWNFYSVTYETHTETFADAAKHLLPVLLKSKLLAPLVLVCYSEGGVVARQMIADGLPDSLAVKALVTICTPHRGILWPVAVDAGSISVLPSSPELKALNDSAAEKAHRGAYHCFGITCTDLWGHHPDDCVVPIKSALAERLGDVAERVTIPLDYNGKIAGWDPHLRGMDPKKVQPVLNTCSQLFK